tara:strand:- start:644 stop:754 length:111 start_codon:yes stop_codon:yes gene_type:complete
MEVLHIIAVVVAGETKETDTPQQLAGKAEAVEEMVL